MHVLNVIVEVHDGVDVGGKVGVSSIGEWCGGSGGAHIVSGNCHRQVAGSWVPERISVLLLRR